jgi:hypothetical protein
MVDTGVATAIWPKPESMNQNLRICRSLKQIEWQHPTKSAMMVQPSHFNEAILSSLKVGDPVQLSFWACNKASMAKIVQIPKRIAADFIVCKNINWRLWHDA